MKTQYEAETLAEFIKFIKAESGDSYDTLGSKIGVSASTVHRLANGGTADDETLDLIADYTGATREWLYALSKQLTARMKYTPIVTQVAALLEQLPPDTQEAFLIQARAYMAIKRRANESDKQVK